MRPLAEQSLKMQSGDDAIKFFPDRFDKVFTTWMENADVNFQLGGNPPNNALIPGTYESVDAFSNLIGCPFNGTWTFQSTDLWGADNGYLCGWDLYFDPALGGDTTAFVPVYGAGCDSTFWSGNDMTWTDAGCDSILVSPSNAGVLELTYRLDGISAQRLRVRLLLTGSHSARPLVTNLRAIVV